MSRGINDFLSTSSDITAAVMSHANCLSVDHLCHVVLLKHVVVLLSVVLDGQNFPMDCCTNRILIVWRSDKSRVGTSILENPFAMLLVSLLNLSNMTRDLRCQTQMTSSSSRLCSIQKKECRSSGSCPLNFVKV